MRLDSPRPQVRRPLGDAPGSPRPVVPAASVPLRALACAWQSSVPRSGVRLGDAPDRLPSQARLVPAPASVPRPPRPSRPSCPSPVRVPAPALLRRCRRPPRVHCPWPVRVPPPGLPLRCAYPAPLPPYLSRCLACNAMWHGCPSAARPERRDWRRSSPAAASGDHGRLLYAAPAPGRRARPSRPPWPAHAPPAAVGSAAVRPGRWNIHPAPAGTTEHRPGPGHARHGTPEAHEGHRTRGGSPGTGRGGAAPGPAGDRRSVSAGSQVGKCG